MIKQYLRYETGQPFGIVIADNNNLGWALCNPIDKFDKRLGEIKALGRAHSGKDWLTELSGKQINLKNKSVRIKAGNRVIEFPCKLFAVLSKLQYLNEKLERNSSNGRVQDFES